MITKEEYQKAKEIVNIYEAEEKRLYNLKVEAFRNRFTTIF